MSASLPPFVSPAPPAWHNRVQTARAQPLYWLAPADEAELTEALQWVRQQGLSLRPVGGGHAQSPLAASAGAMLSTERLRGVSLSAQTRELSVWAGTRWGELWAFERQTLWPLGLRLPQPCRAQAEQTLGGWLASAGLSLSLCSQSPYSQSSESGNSAGGVLLALHLTDTAGEMHRMFGGDPRLGGALSLGALGVVSQLKLRLTPTQTGQDTENKVFLPQEPAQNPASLRQIWWNQVSEKLAKPAKTIDFAELCALGPEYARTRPLRALWTPARADSAALLLDSLPMSKEVAYTVPLTQFSAAIGQLRRQLTKAWQSGSAPLLTVQFQQGGESWLCPTGGEASALLSLLSPAQEQEVTTLRACEDTLRAHGGRPLWDRLHGLGAGELAALYPRWNDFARLRGHLDPQRQLASPYLRHLLGP